MHNYDSLVWIGQEHGFNYCNNRKKSRVGIVIKLAKLSKIEGSSAFFFVIRYIRH